MVLLYLIKNCSLVRLSQHFSDIQTRVTDSSLAPQTLSKWRCWSVLEDVTNESRRGTICGILPLWQQVASSHRFLAPTTLTSTFRWHAISHPPLIWYPTPNTIPTASASTPAVPLSSQNLAALPHAPSLFWIDQNTVQTTHRYVSGTFIYYLNNSL